MKGFLYVFAFFPVLAVFGQEKKKMLDEQTQLTYSINKDDKKDGSYNVKDLSTKSLWLKGAYKGGERSGNWYAYNDKKMQLCYNYDQRKLLFIDSNLLTKADVKVITTNKEIAEKARIPLLICPVNLYLTMLCRNIALPSDIFKQGKAEVKIKAKIDETGKAEYFVIYEDNTGTKEMPVSYKPGSDFSFEWIPARYEQKNLPSEYTVGTVLSNAQATDTFRRFRWTY